MREVLRDGHTEGRVELNGLVGPHTIAVGAMAGLAAEITIDRGHADLAEVLDAQAADGLLIRHPQPGEEAALLLLANVPEWTQHRLPAVPDLASLERAVCEAAQAVGIDTSGPVPFRVEGIAKQLQLHVLDHSCPIADPDGPAPWTYKGSGDAVVLVGFYAENAGGVLTHHGQSSHVHAIVPAQHVSGHLDALSMMPTGILFLPAR
ncbi:MAG: hypothetical protein ACI8QC_003269 [Planctomycetota bacterium]|jgi:hypothetical protein